MKTLMYFSVSAFALTACFCLPGITIGLMQNGVQIKCDCKCNCVPVKPKGVGDSP